MNLKRLYIAGHTGLVGSALLRRFSNRPDWELVTASRRELDLLDAAAVARFLARHKPDQVILAAGRVGGILVNQNRPAEFIFENLMMETNVIHGAYQAGVQRLLNFGSACIYPKQTPQPMRVEQLMTGRMEPTSEPYAVAKLAGMTLCSAYQRQYGLRYISAIPCTVYGPGDHFGSEDSHVLSALIWKLHQARTQGAESVVLWGSGKPEREFIYSDDLAQACELLMEQYTRTTPVNIGSGQPLSIQALAQAVAQAVGYSGAIEWDTSLPDGAPSKSLESSPIHALGWRPGTRLQTGLEQTYQWFLQNQLKPEAVG